MTSDQIYCEKETVGERRDGGGPALAAVLLIQHSCQLNKLSLPDRRERGRGRERLTKRSVAYQKFDSRTETQIYFYLRT